MPTLKTNTSTVNVERLTTVFNDIATSPIFENSVEVQDLCK
jgi:hypothetical protein